MAQLKDKVKIKIYPRSNMLVIWATNCSQFIHEIECIEGVEQIICWTKNKIFVYTDPRYDIEEVSEETKQLLLSEVPDIFKE